MAFLNKGMKSLAQEIKYLEGENSRITPGDQFVKIMKPVYALVSLSVDDAQKILQNLKASFAELIEKYAEDKKQTSSQIFGFVLQFLKDCQNAKNDEAEFR